MATTKKTAAKERLFLVQVTFEVAVLAPDRDVAQSRVINTKRKVIMDKWVYKGTKVTDHFNGIELIEESDYSGV